MCSVCHHFASSGRIEGIALLQDANDGPFEKNSQVYVTIVDNAMAVVFAPDNFTGCSTGDLGYKIIGRAEPLHPCCSHDVAGRPGQGGGSQSLRTGGEDGLRFVALVPP